MSFLLDGQFWETASFVMTVIGLPFAIFIFIWEQHRQRDAEDEEAYQLLQNAYNEFLKIVLANPDLKLRTADATPNMTDEQRDELAAKLSNRHE